MSDHFTRRYLRARTLTLATTTLFILYLVNVLKRQLFVYRDIRREYAIIKHRK